MSALADYRMLWNAAVTARRPTWVALAWRTVPFVMLLAAALPILIKGDWIMALDHALRVPFAVLMFFWIVMFVPAAALLNTPVNARLTPRVRRRLMQMTGLGWLVCAAVPALVLGTSVDHAVEVFLAIACWAIGFGLARGGYLVGAGLQVVVVAIVIAGGPRFAAFATPVVLALASLAVALLGAAALVAIFPRGGERHWKLRRKVERVTERATAAGRFNSGEPRRFGARLYAAVLHRDCARRRAGPLLLHVLGSASHWTQLWLPLGMLLAAVAVASILLRSIAGAETVDTAAGMGWVMFTSLLFMQQVNLERVAARLAATPAEQALLRMAPLSAPASRFNRQLGSALLRYALLDWAAISVVVLLLTALSGASASVLVMQACLCCLGLPLVAALLRDHARQVGMMGWWLLLGGISVAALSGAAGLLASRMLGLPGWPVMALTSAVIALLAVWHRRRTMVAAPVAFPVGRLA